MSNSSQEHRSLVMKRSFVKNKKRMNSKEKKEIFEEAREMNETTTCCDWSSSDDDLQLTSTYEKSQDNLGGLSLFYFLIYCGLYAFLPFLSIVLLRQGFETSQIGFIYTVSFLLSCISSTFWHFVIDKWNHKKMLMTFSVIAWTVFSVPIFVVKVHEYVSDECVNIELKNAKLLELTRSRNFTNIDIVAEMSQNVTKKGTSQHSFKSWLNIHFMTVLYVSIFGTGRLFQSATDYFYFDHQYLIYAEEKSKRYKKSYHVSTKIFAAFVTIFAGCSLDAILYCDSTLGHHQIAFYIFLIFVAFAAFVLYFMDIDIFETMGGFNNIKVPKSNTEKKSCRMLLFQIIFLLCLMVAGITRGVFYTFLQVHLYNVRCLYLEIAAIFAVFKISESMITIKRKRFLSKLGQSECLLLVLFIDSGKNLVYSVITSRKEAWLLLPVEIFSGFAVLLFIDDKKQTDVITQEKMFVVFWCIGFTLGPLLFGITSKFYSFSQTFRGVSVINLIAFLFLLLFYVTCAYKIFQNGGEEPTTDYPEDKKSENETVEFLLEEEERSCS